MMIFLIKAFMYLIINDPMKIICTIGLFAILGLTCVRAQDSTNMVRIEDDEFWYGFAVNEGEKMPFPEGYNADLNGNIYGNQASPLLLSSKGRYIWSEDPFAFKIENGQIILSNNLSAIKTGKSGASLREAYTFVSGHFFPTEGKNPDISLFTSPQYNTWIELIYDQNQEDILQYAHDIIKNGFPPGVLMIDDNWAPYYGRFEFRKDRFPNAKAMVEELHELGFKVMLWISPFIRPDSEEGRFLMKNKWVVMDNGGNKDLKWGNSVKPAIVEWWNGFSMVMDFTNPDASDWFHQQLEAMVKEYGIDGFKFDAGDSQYYAGNAVTYKKVNPNEHTRLWGEFGLKYPLNEYRAMWKMGGAPLVERLRDKLHTWDDLGKLIPHITTAGLLGYPFTCPDMIGGGSFESFIDTNSNKLSQDLIVRSAQCHALMPMMQFSVAPWRVLDDKHLEAVKKAVKIREAFVPEILRLVRNSAKTGEPIVTNMEFRFPNQGFSHCKDQFMLGENTLVAPIITGSNTRTVYLPKGKWVDYKGKKRKGGRKYEYTAEIDEIIWFKKNMESK
ncbi:MAG: glycoside hydrolase family 31 protein [Eubacteriales bacterium]|nr:glycoside hydrolase family 31 protein [Eubacteriales bacterium]